MRDGSVKIKDLVKTYSDDRGRPTFTAVKGINLNIEDGEFMVLVGPSGCGKSTTLRMVAGLERATSGTIEIGGQIANNLEPKKRGIAMVFQNYALYPHMTVFDNMAFGLRLAKKKKDFISEIVGRIAKALALDHVLDRKPHALSGGQRHRVALGRAIARSPHVFLFDEPLSNLDAKIRVQIRSDIAHLHVELGSTKIYVTHDQVEAMTLGDRICVMRDGFIMQVADPLTLYRQPANVFVAGFIGSPPMNLLRGKVQKRDGGMVFCENGETNALTIRLEGPLQTAANDYVDKHIVVGIRPEHIRSERNADSNIPFTLTINIAEQMGSESLVYLKTGTGNLIARIDGEHLFHLGEDMTVYLDVDKVQLFDADTEMVIYRRAIEAVVPARKRVIPPVPEELLAAFASNSVVLFAGFGIAAQAGVPLWAEGWSRVLEAAIKDNPSQNWESLRNAQQKGEFVAVVDLLRARVPHDKLVRMCGEVFTDSSLEKPRLHEVIHEVIREIPFFGVLTNAWDNSLDKTLQHRKPVVLYATDSDQFGLVLREKKFFLLKIDGDASRPEAFLFTAKDYRRAIYEREAFSKFLGSIISSNTLFFAGTNLATIEEFFSGLRLSQNTRRHFALVPNLPTLNFESERFLQRYGVQLLPYDATPKHPEVYHFFNSLWNEIRARPEFLDSLRAEPVTLDRVILRNIGPFRELNLEIGTSWNVLLGNNGCGKSSVLEAIALGLCGDELTTRRVAAKLLNSRAAKESSEAGEGSIELWFGNQKVTTTLTREGSGVTLKSGQLTPFRTGRWLVLGFPPLRGVSQHNPAGPKDVGGMPNPDIPDLLPLIAGGVDARLDSIKQWIINTHVRSKPGDQVTKQRADHNKKLLQSFFEILGELTPGVKCSFHSVDLNTWDVIVTTDDGEVSIDLLSQGTSSIIGWVGVLLERLYEVFPNAPEPEKQPALVLVDEIDAHMHPEWQITLVPLLRRKFPHLQVIATTHSPLIVGNMKSGEVYHLRRESSGSVRVQRIKQAFAGFRADQILTSPAFNLDTTVSVRGKQTMEEYARLLGTANRTPEEEAQLQELSALIETTFPLHGETAEEREAAALLDQILVKELQNQPEENRRKILTGAERLLAKSPSGESK